MNKLLLLLSYLALTAPDLNLEYMQAILKKIANLIGPNNRYTGSEGCRDFNTDKRHVVFPHPFNLSITSGKKCGQ